MCVWHVKSPVGERSLGAGSAWYGRRSVKLRGEGLRSSARREKSDFTECPRALGTMEGALGVEEV